MRASWLAIAVLLAGCTGTAPAGLQGDDSEAVPQYTTPPLLLVAEGTYQWHEPGTTTAGLLVAYNIVTQTAANPCVFQGHIYFNNRPIPSPAGGQRHRSGNLTVMFDWEATDYPFDHLVLGYQAPGMSGLAESPKLPRGQEVKIRIEPDGSGKDSWSLFACLNREDEDIGASTWQAGPFVGSFTVHAEFQGDPELPLKEPEHEGRMSRSG